MSDVPYANIRRTVDLPREAIAHAASSREECAAFLRHVAAISAPKTGCPLVLLLFARLATRACVWLDGALRVEGGGTEAGTTFDLLTEVGVEMSERLFPTVRLRAPLSEFVGVIERIPSVVAPLVCVTLEPGRFVLTATAETRASSLPPPRIDESSLFERVRDSTPKLEM